MLDIPCYLCDAMTVIGQALGEAYRTQPEAALRQHVQAASAETVALTRAAEPQGAELAAAEIEALNTIILSAAITRWRQLQG